MNDVKSLSEDIAEAVSETTKQVEFLAAAYPEISTNLQTVAEILQAVHQLLGVVCELSEKQEKAHKQTVSKFELEKAYKNQAYEFIMTEQLIGRFGLFMRCYPVETYLNKTGLDILKSPENK